MLNVKNVVNMKFIEKCIELRSIVKKCDLGKTKTNNILAD